jgi:hypothetical protein
MNPAMGHKRWAIAEGYIPSWSNGPEPQFTSHETAWLVITADKGLAACTRDDGWFPVNGDIRAS